MLRLKTFPIAVLLAAAGFLHYPRVARAEFLFNSFIVPPDALAADRSSWDVMYSPYNGQNYPDVRAPFGTLQAASAAGFTVPTNASPSDPRAFFDTRNATITQTGDADAFIIDPGNSGNIYSFSGPTAYRVDNSTANYTKPYDLGTVAFQFQTAGTLIDFSTIKLQYTDSFNVQHSLPADELLREYRGDSGSSFGGLLNRTAVQWDLSGLNIRTYQIVFNAAGSSNSLQLATLATAATYGDIIPASRVWTTAGAGNWNGGFSDRKGVAGQTPIANGNVRFVNTAPAATVLDANYAIGELRFDTPAATSVSSPGGFTVTANTGVTTTAASTGTYTVSANYALGAFNIFDIEAGEVALNSAVSGGYGFEKDGAGTLTIGGNASNTGNISVAGGTLKVNGTLANNGTLTLASGATLSGSGTVSRTFSIGPGMTLSPGNSVGMLGTAAETWTGGGIYQFEFNGSQNDLVRITGNLSLTATAGTPFQLQLRTLTLGGAAGAIVGFDQNAARTWQIASVIGGTLTGFDASAFQVDTSGFANGFNGTFGVSSDGSSLFLNYTPVPEPSTMWLLGAGSVAVVMMHRRRR